MRLVLLPQFCLHPNIPQKIFLGILLRRLLAEFASSIMGISINGAKSSLRILIEGNLT